MWQILCDRFCVADSSRISAYRCLTMMVANFASVVQMLVFHMTFGSSNGLGDLGSSSVASWVSGAIMDCFVVRLCFRGRVDCSRGHVEWGIEELGSCGC